MAGTERGASAFTCRLCACDSCAVVLDLGLLPLANDFVASADDRRDQAREPVVLVMCDRCRLLQLRDLVPPERLFGTYLWTTSTSAAAREHAARFARRLAERHPPAGGPFLVELASNDGLLLRELAAAGYDVLGVEPSNLADETSAAGMRTVRAFFAEPVAASIAAERGPADLVVARNVIGHVADLRGFLAGAASLLRPGGVFVVESPCALFLHHELQYDTVFHEHVSYFTVTTLCEALLRFGLVPEAIDFVPMNGGSFLCEARRLGAGAPGPSFGPLLALERVLRINEPEAWTWFGPAVDQQRERLVSMLAGLAAEGATVAGYGAAAKTMTMLSACGIGTDLVRVIADANPRKQGLLCPGVRIPVVSPDELLRLRPDHVLIGPWNFTSEIAGQLRARGYQGELIVPLPVPRLLR